VKKKLDLKRNNATPLVQITIQFRKYFNSLVKFQWQFQKKLGTFDSKTLEPDLVT